MKENEDEKMTKTEETQVNATEPGLIQGFPHYEALKNWLISIYAESKSLRIRSLLEDKLLAEEERPFWYGCVKHLYEQYSGPRTIFLPSLPKKSDFEVGKKEVPKKKRNDCIELTLKLKREQERQAEADAAKEVLEQSIPLDERVKRLSDQYYTQRATVMTARSLPKMRYFGSRVIGSKCQAIRNLQLEQNEVLRRAYQKNEERYKGDILEVSNREKEEKMEQDRIKRNLMKALVQKIHADDILKTSLPKIKYYESASTRLESDKIMLNDFKNKKMRIAKEKSEWRKEMLKIVENTSWIRKYEEKEEALLLKRDHDIQKKNDEFMQNFNDSKMALKKMKEDCIEKIGRANYERELKKNLEEELYLIRAQLRDERKWRQSELKKAELKAQARKELRDACSWQQKDKVLQAATWFSKEKLLSDKIAELDMKFYKEHEQEKDKIKNMNAELRNFLNEQIAESEREKRKDFMLRQKAAATNNEINRLEKEFYSQQIAQELSLLRNEGLGEQETGQLARKFESGNIPE